MKTNTLSCFAQSKLDALEARSRRRTLTDTQRLPDMRCLRGDDETPLISFTDNDYLGLSHHPKVIAAALHATEKYGTGSGASRLVTGNCPLNTKLEGQISALKGSEAAIIFGSGYLANIGIIPALIGKDDLIIADALIHTSLHAGLSLSGAKIIYNRHNDVDHVAAILASERSKHPRVMIVVDGVYSMDGDTAPLKALGTLAAQHDAWVLSDDAHGVGTIGGGRGSTHACGAGGLIHLQMGTLSKAVGCYGGYLAADQAVIDLMKSRGRSLIYTTGLPPATLAAASAALDLIKGDTALTARPLQLAARFTKALGLKAPETPIVPLIIGSEDAALEASEALKARGFMVGAFRPPTVPVGTSRLRFCFSASHKDDDVNALIAACIALGLKKDTASS